MPQTADLCVLPPAQIQRVVPSRLPFFLPPTSTIKIAFLLSLCNRRCPDSALARAYLAVRNDTSIIRRVSALKIGSRSEGRGANEQERTGRHSSLKRYQSFVKHYGTQQGGGACMSISPDFVQRSARGAVTRTS